MARTEHEVPDDLPKLGGAGAANPFLLNLLRRDELSAEERAIALELANVSNEYPENHELVSEGERAKFSILLLSGFAARVNLLRDGRRQITAIHVPGDFVDLHSLLLERMDHSVVTLTGCAVAKVPHERLRALTVSHPHLARMLWLLTVVDAAIYRRWLVAAGRLTAPAQVAHFLCEMFVRLRSVNHAADDHTFRLPISQTELSDAMGLSVVHVNRTLQQLRAEGLLEWQSAQVRLPDWDRVTDLAEFDPTYLNLVRTRR